MTHLVDRYLLFRVRTKRDPEAFARLYDRYVEAIYRFVYLKLPRKEDAQDITAETFTRAWQFLHETRQVFNIRAFLYRIARNLIADFYRSQKQELSVEELVTFESSGASTGSEGIGIGTAHLPAIDHLSETRAELSLILSRLSRLKEDYQDVLTLRLIDDLPFAVIADILEKKTGHVRVIYHRAIKALNELDKKVPKNT